MGAPIQANGSEDYHTEKVPLNLYKLGIFKVKGEKPRIGYFEDNVLVSESRQKILKKDRSIDGHRDSLILAMIPEVSKRKKVKRGFQSEKKNSRNPISTSSTMSFMGNTTSKRTWRSRQK